MMKLIDFINMIDLDKLESVEFDSYSAFKECNEPKFYRINKDTLPLVIEFIRYLRTLTYSVPPKRTLIIDKEYCVSIVKVYEGGEIKNCLSPIDVSYKEILGMNLILNHHDLDDFQDQIRYLDKLSETLTYDFLIYSENDRLDYIKAKKIEKALQEKQMKFESSTEMKIKIKKGECLTNITIGLSLLLIAVFIFVILFANDKCISNYSLIGIGVTCVYLIAILFLFFYSCKLTNNINKLFKKNIDVIIDEYKCEYPTDAKLFDKNYIKVYSNII